MKTSTWHVIHHHGREVGCRKGEVDCKKFVTLKSEPSSTRAEMHSGNVTSLGWIIFVSELDMEHQTGSNWKRSTTRQSVVTLFFNFYAENIMWNAGLRMKHKLKSWLLGKISKPQMCRWYHPNGRKWRETKESVDASEKMRVKSWLKTQLSFKKTFKKLRSWHPVLSLHGK